MGKWFKSGAPWIWMTGGAVSLSLVAVLGLLLLIGWRGLVYFWPHPIYEWQLEDASGNKSVLIGEINDREMVPVERLRAAREPRLVIVEHGPPPVTTDELEDWLRAPADETETRLVAPVARLWTKMSTMPLLSPATRLSA